MKKVIVFTVLLIQGFVLVAQEDEPHFLLPTKKLQVGGFGGVITEFSAFNGRFAVFTGGGGAILINRCFFLGAYGSGLATEMTFPAIYPSDHNPASDPKLPIFENLIYKFNHGGLWTGYSFEANRVFHMGMSFRVGGGEVSLVDPNRADRYQFALAKDNIVVIQPEVNIEVNVVRWLRIRGGAGYRFVGSLDNLSYTTSDGSTKNFYTTSDFNAPYANVALLFGSFGAKKPKAITN